jgi:GcrA cell cycle regulator
MDTTWTPERVGQLTDLWNAGLPAAEIGRRMAVTKNTIIGKVHRLGLDPRIVKTPAPLPGDTWRETFSIGGCLWPIGNPSVTGFRFCGAEKPEGKPYCEAHEALAHRKPTSTEKALCNNTA